MTLTECYARFGIAVKNPRQAWSEQGPDGTVVVTLWSDFFTDVDRREYIDRARGVMNAHQNKKRIKHLQYAKQHCDGIFQSIIVTRKDASRKSTATRELGSRMRLIKLDDQTGEFHAIRVTP